MMRYVVPEKCIRCHSAGYVELTVRTPGGAVAISWLCRHCHHVWAIAQHEQQVEEQRSGPPDRRRVTRVDRRKPRSI
jgi:hypothetical protein